MADISARRSSHSDFNLNVRQKKVRWAGEAQNALNRDRRHGMEAEGRLQEKQHSVAHLSIITLWLIPSTSILEGWSALSLGAHICAVSHKAPPYPHFAVVAHPKALSPVKLEVSTVLATGSTTSIESLASGMP